MALCNHYDHITVNVTFTGTVPIIIIVILIVTVIISVIITVAKTRKVSTYLRNGRVLN